MIPNFDRASTQYIKRESQRSECERFQCSLVMRYQQFQIYKSAKGLVIANGGLASKQISEVVFTVSFYKVIHLMNTFTTFQREYLRPSRTIETILVSKENLSQVYFIYNYEGNSFRVFKNHLDLILFFQDKTEGDFEFGTEEALDWFLAKVYIAE
ncbi:hypothetical protein BXY82_1168 [Gelidibacter sediminis]|uniref:Uncharacterized protein n=1 Tax=Gelidibacter sediminis TaxID=1608710 RepID=A0A4R7QAF3_9FLAO|nr:hypothetical protein [Gelidibacter sediminis]TDU43750.1 hypothetical protein BXY82_1168 [Gelidibacter sediminis]